MIRGFEKLDLWKLSHELALKIYRESEQFPARERYGITLQLRRAAVSIPTNIAEGSARFHPQEFLQFCNISRGSVAEVRYLLRFVNDLGWLDSELYDSFGAEYDRVGQMLNAMTRRLKRIGKSRARV